MDKLEKILAAEDDAARTVEKAREKARDIRLKADVEAASIREAAAAKAVAQAAADRESALETARAEASEIERGSSQRLCAAVAEARSRFDDAVDAVVSELAG